MAPETEPPKPPQKPSPCRMVLFGWTGGSQGVTELPATVIRVLPDGRVDLCLHGAGRYLEAHAVHYAETPRAGCWSWPPRV